LKYVLRVLSFCSGALQPGKVVSKVAKIWLAIETDFIQGFIIVNLIVCRWCAFKTSCRICVLSLIFWVNWYELRSNLHSMCFKVVTAYLIRLFVFACIWEVIVIIFLSKKSNYYWFICLLDWFKLWSAVLKCWRTGHCTWMWDFDATTCISDKFDCLMVAQ